MSQEAFLPVLNVDLLYSLKDQVIFWSILNYVIFSNVM